MSGRHHWWGLVAAAVVLASCSATGAEDDPSLPPPAPSTTAAPQQLDLDFETLEPGEELKADVSIPQAILAPDGYVVTGQGPQQALRTVPGADGGTAIKFPEPCVLGVEGQCPKAIIEMPPEPEYDPGSRPFSYGAVLRMKPTETGVGANVVQKGFSTGGDGQWKLQVDGEEALPSCVLVGFDEEVHRLVGTVGVADDEWHEVSCSRDKGVLLLEVDGVEHGRLTVPSGLFIAPPGPVRVGGKNVKPDNDQFFGSLDAVFYTVSED